MARELAIAKARHEKVPMIAREHVRPEIGAQLARWMREQVDAYQLGAETVAKVAVRAYLQEEGRVQENSYPLSWMVYSGAALSAAVARAAAPRSIEQLAAPRALASGDNTRIGFDGAGSLLAAIGGAR